MIEEKVHNNQAEKEEGKEREKEREKKKGGEKGKVYLMDNIF